MGEISQLKYSEDDRCDHPALCSLSMPTKSPKNTAEKNILRITVRLACLPPAILSPSDIANKDKHNGIILMSLFSKEQQHWQYDCSLHLAASPPFPSHLPVPCLLHFSLDVPSGPRVRCVFCPHHCVCSSRMAFWLFPYLSHPWKLW